MTDHRSARRVWGTRRALAVLLSIGLVAGACSKKDDDESSPGTTAAPGSTAPDAPDAPDATDAPDTSDSAPDDTADDGTDTTAAPEPAGEPVYGGSIVVSGEAEVANPWTPAAMQCDQYCYVRAGSFYEPLVAINADGEVSGVLLESLTPNDDFTEWTGVVRRASRSTTAPRSARRRRLQPARSTPRACSPQRPCPTSGATPTAASRSRRPTT
ncbi:MAG: hypothetical protein R2713_02745 [Ilumatobacteraceae bacterium]